MTKVLAKGKENDYSGRRSSKLHMREEGSLGSRVCDANACSNNLSCHDSFLQSFEPCNNSYLTDATKPKTKMYWVSSGLNSK